LGIKGRIAPKAPLLAAWPENDASPSWTAYENALAGLVVTDGEPPQAMGRSACLHGHMDAI